MPFLVGVLQKSRNVCKLRLFPTASCTRRCGPSDYVKRTTPAPFVNRGGSSWVQPNMLVDGEWMCYMSINHQSMSQPVIPSQHKMRLNWHLWWGRAMSPRGYPSQGSTPRVRLGNENDSSSRLVQNLDCAAFSAVMEEALQRHRGPRNYLLPIPATSKDPDEPKFQPEISMHSRVGFNSESFLLEAAKEQL